MRSTPDIDGTLAPDKAPAIAEPIMYRSSSEHLRVLEGTLFFGMSFRAVMNGTTTKNGQPMPHPETVEGQVIALCSTPTRGTEYSVRLANGRLVTIAMSDVQYEVGPAGTKSE